jgi:hypothetical protein
MLLANLTKTSNIDLPAIFKLAEGDDTEDMILFWTYLTKLNKINS